MARSRAGLLWSPLVALSVVGGLLCTLTSCQSQQQILRPGAPTTSATVSEPPRLARPQQLDQPIQLVQHTLPRPDMLPPPPPPTTVPAPTTGAPPAPPSPANALSNPLGFNVSIAAWVNGQPVYRDELLNEAGAKLHDVSSLPDAAQAVERPKILKAELQKLIEREAVLQDAYIKLGKHKVFMEKLKDHASKMFERWSRTTIAKSGVGEGPFWEAKRRQGWTKESIRRKFERDLVFEQYLRSRVGTLPDQVGHGEMREYYETHLNEFQTVDRVKWQNIFIAVGKQHPTMEQARQAASAILHRAWAGEDFARFLNMDEGVSSANGGYGIGELRGQIQPQDVEPYLWSLRDGQVGPPVEISTGIHLFRLVKRDYGGQLSFTEEVQNKIRAKLRDEIFERESRRLVRELVSRAVVEYDAEALK